VTDERYRLVIVGAGSAGLAAADFAARVGVSVALVERDRIGGDCTWTGCVPSKALLHMAHRRADFPSAMAFVQQAIHRVYESETPQVLARRGIAVIEGDGRFVEPRVLDVGGRRIVPTRS
jgi:pyruvate/2-oxoglutarate dehydrogenase complex dihydrolipoamide dehydrogenase (E3) component